VKKIEERKKEIEKQERELRAQQEALLKRLEGVEVMVERRANEQGHLYGAVSATDIAKALQAQGFNVEAADVNLPGKLDRIDKYQVTIKFAEELAGEIKVWVNPDADSKAAMEAHSKAKAEPDKTED
jgi:large subunit ribosomal protein L9